MPVYLYWLGVIGGERSGFKGFAGQNPTPYQGDKSELVIFIERIWIYTRELFTADWISWPVFLWFVSMILLTWQVYRKQAVGAPRQVRRRTSEPTTAHPLPKRFSATTSHWQRREKVILMGALFALFSAMLSVQPIWMNSIADLRYYVGALPLLLAMKGLFVEWAWRRMSSPAH